MTREQLVQAAEECKQASAGAEADASERLESHAETLRKLANADHGPDHGRLDRIMHGLSELGEEVGDDAADHVSRAYDHVEAYRETVSGV